MIFYPVTRERKLDSGNEEKVVCATCWLINPIEHTSELQIFCNTNNTKPDEEGKLKFSFVNLMAYHHRSAQGGVGLLLCLRALLRGKHRQRNRY
jgi:hypothetical protein